METERRYVALEFRADERELSGVALRYGDTATLPWGLERFEAGAFAPIGDVILNRQHNRDLPLARTGAGLELVDTAEALRMVAKLPETRDSADTLALVRAGILRGLSIEFAPVSERMDGAVRVISAAKLSGIAVVDSAAYSQSEVQARAAHMRTLEPKPRRVWIL